MTKGTDSIGPLAIPIYAFRVPPARSKVDSFGQVVETGVDPVTSRFSGVRSTS